MPSFWHETCTRGTGLDSKCAQGAISRRVLLPAAILFVANLLQPVDVLAVDGRLDGDVGHGSGGRCAVPVLDAWRKPDHVAGPDLLLRSPHCCTQPRPNVMTRVCPTGCVCQAERAPGSKVTCPPDTRDGAVAGNIGSTRTAPVKYSADPLADGCEPARVIRHV